MKYLPHEQRQIDRNNEIKDLLQPQLGRKVPYVY